MWGFLTKDGVDGHLKGLNGKVRTALHGPRTLVTEHGSNRVEIDAGVDHFVGCTVAQMMDESKVC